MVLESCTPATQIASDEPAKIAISSGIDGRTQASGGELEHDLHVVLPTLERFLEFGHRHAPRDKASSQSGSAVCSASAATS